MSALTMQEKFSKKLWNWWVSLLCPICQKYPKLRKGATHPEVIKLKKKDVRGRYRVNIKKNSLPLG